MAGFDDALERLVTDPGFRAQMEQDPQAALANYDLTDDERQLLTSQLSHEAGASGGVEQRTSKSGLAGALGMLDVGPDAPQADGHSGEVDVVSWSWGMTQSGTMHDDNADALSSGDVDDAEHTKKDVRVSKYTDASGDVDQPVIVGSVYNPEGDAASPGGTNEIRFEDKPGTEDIPQENMTLHLGKMEHGTEDLEAMATEGDPQGQLPGDLADREPSEEPDMGSPYLKMAAFSDTMDPPGDPDALVADGTDERPSSPKLVQPLVNNEVVEHDEPDVVMTDQDADTKEAPVKTGYDIKANKRV